MYVYRIAIAYDSWIQPMHTRIYIWCFLYLRATWNHLGYLDSIQTHVGNMYGLTFPSLTAHRNASILGLTWCPLAGERH